MGRVGSGNPSHASRGVNLRSMNLHDMHGHAMNAPRPTRQAMMACLAEDSRFRLAQVLVTGARCVTELAAEVGLSQSCTTRHLQALERWGIVRRKRDGKRVLYRLRDDEPGLVPLLGWALRSRSTPGYPGREPRRQSRDAEPGPRHNRGGEAPRGTSRRRSDTTRGPGAEAPEGRSEEIPSGSPQSDTPGVQDETQRPPAPPTPGAEASPAPRPRTRRGELEDYLL